jgi:hypothetical protein
VVSIVPSAFATTGLSFATVKSESLKVSCGVVVPVR